MTVLIVINLCMKSKMSFNNPLQITFNPDQINFLLQCFALNITYTDGFDEHFWFYQDKPLKLVNESKFEAF